MHTNHPPQPRSMEKLLSMKLVPGAKMFGDCYTSGSRVALLKL